MGQPWPAEFRQTWSSCFKSMLAAPRMPAGARPCAAKSRKGRFQLVSCGSPLAAHAQHPDTGYQMQRFRGRFSRVGQGKIRRFSCPANATPAGGVPGTGQSDASGRVPSQQRPADQLDPLRLQHGAVLGLAHSSTANTPLASVAVVMTGTAPQTAASARASSLAPPRWPESSGTANRPHSSSTTTAGSVALLRQWGAMARTAMPTAPTKIRASACANCALSNRPAGRRPRRSGQRCRAVPGPAGGPEPSFFRKGQIGAGHCFGSVAGRYSVAKAGS